MHWLVSLLIGAAAVVAEWFVAPLNPRFGLVQGIISLVIFFAVVLILACFSRLGTRTRRSFSAPERSGKRLTKIRVSVAAVMA